MAVVAVIATAGLAVILVLHLATAALTLVHARRLPRPAPAEPASDPSVAAFHPDEPVAFVVPVVGLDAAETAAALGALDVARPGDEVIFCAFDEADPVVERIRAALARRPEVDARLLVGRAHVSDNPKMDNVEKGFAAAHADLVICVDGNLELPPDALARLFEVAGPGVALVSSPPVGTRPESFWAAVECAFLDTFFARWQLSADVLGGGFAHGKILMLRRSFLDTHGGVTALARETAEDAAATRMVREAGLAVRLTRRPFAQPLGRRTFAEVWSRNLRWARLRRRAYRLVYLGEITMPIFAALALALLAAPVLGLATPALLAAVTILWWGTEAVLARAMGWPWGWWALPARVARDGLAVALWFAGWFGSGYVWRGQTVEIDRPAVTARSDRDSSGSA